MSTTKNKNAMQWIAGHDTGVSSKTIWSHMMGARVERAPWGTCPLDPSDFGRCHRLLLLVPEWRPRLPEMAKYSKWWAGLVAAWDELDALYLEELPSGVCPKLYDRMKAIEKESRRRTPDKASVAPLSQVGQGEQTQ